MLKAESKKNVLINFRGGIGDFIIFSPVLRNIKIYGRYNLFFLGSRIIQQFEKEHDYFKEFIFIDYNGNIFRKLITFIKVFFKLKNLKIHICITPICSFGKFSYLITKLSGAELRIGFDHEKTSGVYTHIVKINISERDVDQNMKLLKILDVKPITKEPELIIPEHSFIIADDYFSEHHIDLDKRTIAIAPFVKGMSDYSSREWPLDKYIKLIEEILNKFKVNIILMGSKNELDKLESIKEFFPSRRLFFQDRSFSIYEAAALLKKCSLLICNDGGMMHIAAAINTSIISIWGPTSPAWRGYLEKNNFIAIRKNNCSPCKEYKKPPTNCKERKCLKEISVDEVLGACEMLLDKRD